jgi:carbon storage regulator
VLVLSRHRDESIIFTIPDGIPAGTRIIMTVVDIRGDKVRLGIAAPIEVSINRSEIQDRIDSGESTRRDY